MLYLCLRNICDGKYNSISCMMQSVMPEQLQNHIVKTSVGMIWKECVSTVREPYWGCLISPGYKIVLRRKQCPQSRQQVQKSTEPQCGFHTKGWAYSAYFCCPDLMQPWSLSRMVQVVSSSYPALFLWSPQGLAGQWSMVHQWWANTSSRNLV